MFTARSRLDWTQDGADWPNREASRFVKAGNIKFHVQIMGRPGAPCVLLIHGTGASSHSFRDVMPLLAGSFRVVAPDLPGHGFTDSDGSDLSLPGMAHALGTLMTALKEDPVIAAGHSAGTAILIQMVLDGSIHPTRIIGFNSALKPIEGDALFSPLAKMLFLNPFVPRAFSAFARHTAAADRLLDRTGTEIDAHGKRLYARLLESPAHVSGALGMMANWNLAPLRARFAAIPCAVTLVAAGDDAMVPPSVSREAASQITGCEFILADHGGHLLHEVDSGYAARLIAERAERDQSAMQTSGPEKAR